MSGPTFIITRDNRFRCLISGSRERPWLTLLHSLATSAELWDDQVAALEPHFRLLRIDARGHGGSQATPGPYSFDGLCADVVGIWDALDIARSAVLGLSMGGMTAVGLGLDHPARVTRLVAADCRLDAPEFFQNMWAARRTLLAEGGLATVAEATLPTWLTAETRAQRPDLVEKVRAMILGTSPDGYVGATGALERLDYKRRLGALKRPALFVSGAADGPHPAEMRALAALVPGAAYVEIEGAAHLANAERPAAFNNSVAGFLTARGEEEAA